MLRFLGHRALLAGDLSRLAFLGPRSRRDPRDGLAPQRHAQVVATLSQLECSGARCPLTAFGTNGAQEKRRFALPRIECERILEFCLTFVKTPSVPLDHPREHEH